MKPESKYNHLHEEPSAPLLNAIPKVNPFAVPQDYFEKSKQLSALLYQEKLPEAFVVPAAYFETFPEHISQLVLLSKVEKPLPSEAYFEALQYRLQKVLLPHQQHPFAAPDAYFDSLAMRVQERLYEQKQAKPLLRELRPAFALRPMPLAAILLTILALGIGYTFYSPTETQEASLAGKTKVPMALEPVSTELAEVALSTELAHADESLLAEAADESDISRLPVQELVASDKKTVETEVVSDYLLNNRIDENELTEWIGS
ncbi:MAG: hypothetical protein ACK5CV_04640 [Bacteroidota bacterium]|jgi:hypothetical protein